MLVHDQLQRPIALKGVPKRIISLVPSQTELLFDLGLEASIIGITKFCVHPEHLRKTKTVVGGTKSVHFDRIKALEPDIILCNKEENTKEMISELEQIAPTHLSDIETIEDSLELTKMYGEIFDVQEASEKLITKIIELKAQFESEIHGLPEVNVAYFIWKNPWMVAGSHTFINEMLKINKFKNVFSKLERYPEIDMKDLGRKDVYAIFLSSEPFPFKTNHLDDFKSRFPQVKTLIVDGEAFSWYGSRLIHAFSYFRRLREELLK